MTNDEIHKRTNSYRITAAGFYWFPMKNTNAFSHLTLEERRIILTGITNGSTKSVFETQPSIEKTYATLAVLPPRKIDVGHCVQFHNKNDIPYKSNASLSSLKLERTVWSSNHSTVISTSMCTIRCTSNRKPRRTANIRSRLRALHKKIVLRWITLESVHHI